MMVLLRIVSKIYETNKGTSMLQIKGLKDSYMHPVEDLGESLVSKDGSELMMLNRLRLRQYLKELHIYT
jgi:hypothetical protein